MILIFSQATRLSQYEASIQTDFVLCNSANGSSIVITGPSSLRTAFARESTPYFVLHHSKIELAMPVYSGTRMVLHHEDVWHRTMEWELTLQQQLLLQFVSGGVRTNVYLSRGFTVKASMKESDVINVGIMGVVNGSQLHVAAHATTIVLDNATRCPSKGIDTRVRCN